MNELFENREHAGKRLAEELQGFAGRDDVVVLALPRGGVPVASEVARALHAPLDVFVVRKLGVPGREELAMGAIASGGALSLNDDVVLGRGIPTEVVEAVAARELRELVRREHAYRGARPLLDLTGKVAILVDDGLATGASMRAAVIALRHRNPARIVVAVPAAPRETCEEMGRIADEVVCAETPEPFWSVGTWYWDFSQTTDDEVRDLLARAWESHAASGSHL
jgi:predicted phosphoribosyltransferase